MIKINKLANFNEKLNLLRVTKKLPNPLCLPSSYGPEQSN